jgi:hypothetical protein
MDHPLTPEQQDLVIEDALRSHPVAPLPRDLSADVMERIAMIPRPRPIHLTWSDLALAILLSICLAALWFSLNSLPPLVVAQIRKESILLYQRFLINARWLLPALAFGLAGFLAALTIPYWKRQLRG